MFFLGEITMSDYSEKFKDPRWQKKRLEMFEDAGWKCERCDSKTETLNLHHKFYKPNTDPWNYKDHWFEVLCNDCHDKAHAIDISFIDLIDSVLKSKLNNNELEKLFMILNVIGSDESGWYGHKLMKYISKLLDKENTIL